MYLKLREGWKEKLKSYYTLLKYINLRAPIDLDFNAGIISIDTNNKRLGVNSQNPQTDLQVTGGFLVTSTTSLMGALIVTGTAKIAQGDLIVTGSITSQGNLGFYATATTPLQAIGSAGLSGVRMAHARVLSIGSLDTSSANTGITVASHTTNSGVYNLTFSPAFTKTLIIALVTESTSPPSTTVTYNNVSTTGISVNTATFSGFAAADVTFSIMAIGI